MLLVSQPLNILLVGPRRTGKSSSGNTLLDRAHVFHTRGGGASTAACGITAGRPLMVVDAQGWGLSEELVPTEDKVELLRAMSLFGLGGPHVVLLVIPLLDFTESEGRAVERRMEVLTSGVWRHTMVLFTCGDRLKRRGRSAKEHIQSGGSALHRLMEKCRYRYHVFNNKAVGRRNNPNQEPDRRKGGEQELEQVRELLIKVENMLQENGGWHFSLHMYQRMEEEWSCRELELRHRLVPQTHEGHERSEQMAAEPGNATEQRQTSDMEAKARLLKLAATEMQEIHIWEEEKAKVELRSEEGEYDGSEESTKMKASLVAPRWPNTSQGLEFNPLRKLA